MIFLRTMEDLRKSNPTHIFHQINGCEKKCANITVHIYYKHNLFVSYCWLKCTILSRSSHHAPLFASAYRLQHLDVHSKQRRDTQGRGDDGDEVCDSLERGTRNAAINKKECRALGKKRSECSWWFDWAEREALRVWACARSWWSESRPERKQNKKRGAIFFLN